jgi:hypothetical protein
LRIPRRRAETLNVPEGERHAPELGIEPEPDADVRAALEHTLARLRTREPTPGRSAWWRAGIRENLAGAAGERAPDPADR